MSIRFRRTRLCKKVPSVLKNFLFSSKPKRYRRSMKLTYKMTTLSSYYQNSLPMYIHYLWFSLIRLYSMNFLTLNIKIQVTLPSFVKSLTVPFDLFERKRNFAFIYLENERYCWKFEILLETRRMYNLLTLYDNLHTVRPRERGTSDEDSGTADQSPKSRV